MLYSYMALAAEHHGLIITTAETATICVCVCVCVCGRKLCAASTVSNEALCRHRGQVGPSALARDHPHTMSNRAPVQAMTGMIFKKLFNQALIVWDHCVYVRERLLWYDTEKAMPFLVRDTLARLHRAAAEVLYAEADLVTPCCATFNVDWEQWLGHAPETIMPVVNGLDFNTVGCSSACVA